MATIRWCPIFPKWDSYQPLDFMDKTWRMSRRNLGMAGLWGSPMSVAAPVSGDNFFSTPRSASKVEHVRSEPLGPGYPGWTSYSLLVFLSTEVSMSPKKIRYPEKWWTVISPCPPYLEKQLHWSVYLSALVFRTVQCQVTTVSKKCVDLSNEPPLLFRVLERWGFQVLFVGL